LVSLRVKGVIGYCAKDGSGQFWRWYENFRDWQDIGLPPF